MMDNLEICPFRGTYNNNNHGSIPKYFNNNIETSSSGPPKATFAHHKPKVNSVWFVDPYDLINTMDNTNDEIHFVN